MNISFDVIRNCNVRFFKVHIKRGRNIEKSVIRIALSNYSYRQLLKTDSKTEKMKNEFLKKVRIFCS